MGFLDGGGLLRVAVQQAGVLPRWHSSRRRAQRVLACVPLLAGHTDAVSLRQRALVVGAAPVAACSNDVVCLCPWPSHQACCHCTSLLVWSCRCRACWRGLLLMLQWTECAGAPFSPVSRPHVFHNNTVYIALVWFPITVSLVCALWFLLFALVGECPPCKQQLCNRYYDPHCLWV